VNYFPWCFDIQWDDGKEFQGARELLLQLLMPPGEFCPSPLCAIGADVYM
jgi:hypothetical protein